MIPTLPDGETFSNNGYSYFDGSAGLSFNTQIGENEDNNIYVGIAYQHFNKSAKVSFYNTYDVELIPKIVFSAGLKMSVKRLFVSHILRRLFKTGCKYRNNWRYALQQEAG